MGGLTAIIEYIGTLKFLAGYRTKIGLIATVLAYVLTFLMDPATQAAWPNLVGIAHFAQVAGPLLAIIGARWKDDPK